MSSTVTPSPLIGDGHGRYRVLILGNSGSGKSTLGARLSSMLQVPFVSLDRVYWQAGWISISNDEFKRKITHILEQTEDAWVVEGDYGRKIGSTVLDLTTDVIWLDPPLLLYFPRILWRTLLRLAGLEEPCSPGCPERLAEVLFSRESILLWCLTHHSTVRERNLKRMAEIGIGEGSDVKRRRMRRLGGWGHQYSTWVGLVEQQFKGQKDD